MTDVEFLRGMRFSWTKIAQILGISRATLYRRLEEEGVSPHAYYSTISDLQLDHLVQSIKQVHPNDGERMMIGHLAQHNVIVPRARLRASIHRVDPINTAVRRSVTIRRRVYHADGPNSVWHIDGHHKLIRWGFVTHAGIDGYSRTIVYLRCSDNNRAETVMSAFQEAVQKHGLPSKVRSDLGGENADVWRYMVEQHSDSSAIITGASTHNQRVERLWRDVFRCVSVLFYETFYKMEEEGTLDSINQLDLFCLRFVFLKRINSALDSFVESWNNHPVSSARNMTPNQLFIQGAIEQNLVPLCTPPSLPTQPSLYLQQPRDHVRVPQLSFTPCSVLVQIIGTVDCSRESVDFGCDIYQQITTMVGQHLLSGCGNCSF